MLTENTIGRTAALLSVHFGPAAEQEALDRANRAKNDGDLESEVLWKRVAQTAAELTAKMSEGDKSQP